LPQSHLPVGPKAAGLDRVRCGQHLREAQIRDRRTVTCADDTISTLEQKRLAACGTQLARQGQPHPDHQAHRLDVFETLRFRLAQRQRPQLQRRLAEATPYGVDMLHPGLVHLEGMGWLR